MYNYTTLTYESGLRNDVRPRQVPEVKVDQRNKAANKKVIPEPTYLTTLDAGFLRIAAVLPFATPNDRNGRPNSRFKRLQMSRFRAPAGL